jgi:PAS domain S-box-containing protein
MDDNLALEKLNALSNLLLNKYGHLVSIPPGDIASVENAIEAIDSYYDKIISCMPGNVYWLDSNATCIGCNKNVLDMFGLTSVKQFRGLSFEEMGLLGNWTPAATQSFKNDTLEVVRTGKPRLNVEEPPIPHADGRVIYFLTSRVPVFDRNGSVIAVVGISIDITDRKEMEIALKAEKEKAELANRTKSEFIKNMSHDVKTPLSGIIGMANLLTKAVDEKQRIECAIGIEEAAQQLMTFFENCLDMSRADTREVIFAKESFNLKNLLNQLTQLFQPSIKNKGLAFAIEYPEDIPQSFIGSSAALYRILLNLIGNAIKFTHDGSIKIFVNVSQGNPSKSMVKLAVEDTGVGIPAEKQNFPFLRRHL